LPAEWREHYAELAADWIRENGTVPPSLEALAEWGCEPLDVDLDAEIAFLQGRGPDPFACRKSG
jgi:hypothetical protein